MLGYYKDEAATRQTIEPDGWLHTGDLGSMDADGYVTITGRRKEILVLSNGKNVRLRAAGTRARAQPLYPAGADRRGRPQVRHAL